MKLHTVHSEKVPMLTLDIWEEYLNGLLGRMVDWGTMFDNGSDVSMSVSNTQILSHEGKLERGEMYDKVTQ